MCPHKLVFRKAPPTLLFNSWTRLYIDPLIISIILSIKIYCRMFKLYEQDTYYNMHGARGKRTIIIYGAFKKEIADQKD